MIINYQSNLGRWLLAFAAVFALLIVVSVNVYGIYIGVYTTLIEQTCSTPLIPWIVTQGCISLATTSLIIAASVPSTPRVNFNDDSFKIRDSDEPSPLPRKILIALLGILYLLSICWFIAGTVWLANTNSESCNKDLYTVALVLIVLSWCFAIVLCGIATAASFVKRRHPNPDAIPELNLAL